MKKLLAIFLALMMILSVSLMACQKDEEPNVEDDVEDDDFIVNKNNKKDTTDTGDGNDEEDEGVDTSKGGSSNWEDANYLVYSMAKGLNVRTSTSEISDKLGQLNIGESVQASSRNDRWYKVTYKDTTAYISREYVTASLDEATFNKDTTPTPLTLAANHIDAQINLRNDPVVSEDTLGITYTKNSTGTLTKVGQNTEGNWFMVEYDADGEGAGSPVTYYLKMTSSMRQYFGLTSGGSNGYS